VCRRRPGRAGVEPHREENAKPARDWMLEKTGIDPATKRCL
jgi:hypothetical protein